MTRNEQAEPSDALLRETSVPWIGKASYWTPSHLVPSAWHEHAPFMFWLIDALRPDTYVELGSHNGFSYFAVCEAVARLGLSTRCAAVDSWEGDEHAGFYSDEVYASVSEINDRDYASFSRLIRSYFSDAVAEFPDASIELLHIDGRHRYEDALEDFETYLPKLAPTAVVLFHDTFEFDRGFGVHRLWADLAARHPETSFQFEHGHGLGVLGIGPDLPEAVTQFFAAARREPDRIRGDYARLGSVIESRAERDADLAGSRHQVEVLRGEIEALREHARRLDEAVEAERARFAEITGSTSWRMTAPGRRIVERLRRR